MAVKSKSNGSLLGVGKVTGGGVKNLDQERSQDFFIFFLSRMGCENRLKIQPYQLPKGTEIGVLLLENAISNTITPYYIKANSIFVSYDDSPGGNVNIFFFVLSTSSKI